MEFTAIVERRTTDRFVHIPELDTCGAMPHLDEPRPFATALAAAATGLPVTDIRVSLVLTAMGQTVVPIMPIDVEVLHDDGAWHPARQTAFLRQWHGSWGPLVTYTVDGSTWERAVPISRVRPRLAELSAVLRPRLQRIGDPQPCA